MKRRDPHLARTLCTLVPLLLAGSACGPASTAVPPPARAAAEPAPRAEILWDGYGVPHIHARDEEALFRAFGWAQARNHGDLLLRLLGQSRARGAEYWGAEELDNDRWLLTLDVPERARAEYARAPAELRRLVDAFADGINAYVRAHPEAVADEVEVVLPVTGADVVARGMSIGLLFSSARPLAARWGGTPGSNAWAVAPSKSASGNALLLANPHLPWGGPFTWFEAQLTGPGVDAYGAALLGMPVLNIAFNRHLGWTHTVNTQDAEDLYELTLAPGGYRWDGAVRAFEVDTVWLHVRQPAGAPADSMLVRRRSVHGPVLAERGGKALAVRTLYVMDASAFTQWWAMMRARNLAEFERALTRHHIVGQNVTYADRDGNILYSYGAATPRRPRGDYAFWRRALPGDTSALLWTGTHGYAEMPRVLNPPTSWVQNANDGPWFSTFPPVLDAGAFPAYFAPTGLGFRPQQSIQLLVENGKISLDEVVRLKHSTEMELAVRLVPELVAAARASTSADARAAADVLERWDRTADADSRGGVLFAEWVREMARQSRGLDAIFSRPWSAADPLGTPDGLADPAASVAALEAAAHTVRQRWGAANVPWGAVHRLRRDTVDLPANGAPGELGTFRVTEFARAQDGRMVPAHGDTYVAAVEFSNPVRARALLGYGNASQPGSPHRTDQLRLYAAKQLRPVWLTRAEVLANLEARETF